MIKTVFSVSNRCIRGQDPFLDNKQFRIIEVQIITVTLCVTQHQVKIAYAVQQFYGKAIL